MAQPQHTESVVRISKRDRDRDRETLAETDGQIHRRDKQTETDEMERYDQKRSGAPPQK